jgi:hypothetical protein
MTLNLPVEREITKKKKKKNISPKIKRTGRELPNHPYQMPGLRMNLDMEYLHVPIQFHGVHKDNFTSLLLLILS